MHTSSTHNFIREIGDKNSASMGISSQTVIRDHHSGMMLFEAESNSLRYALKAIERNALKKSEDIGELKYLLWQKNSEMVKLEISLQSAIEEKQKYRDYVTSSNETIHKMSDEKTALIVDVKKMQWTLNDTVAKIKALKSEKNAAIKKLNEQIKESEGEKNRLAEKYERLLAKQTDSGGFKLVTVGAPASKNQNSRKKQTVNKKTVQSIQQKTFVCEMGGCEKKFDKKKSFDRHMLRHKTQLICGECSFKFSQLADLKRHMLRHTGEKPFSCDLCSKTFAQKANLKQHLKVHHS